MKTNELKRIITTACFELGYSYEETVMLLSKVLDIADAINECENISKKIDNISTILKESEI